MRFISNFPGGNGKMLCFTEKEWGFQVEFLAESKAREPMPLWFYFRLEDLWGEKVRLRLCNSAQCLGNPEGWTHNHPVFRYKGGKWHRVSQVENRWTQSHRLETWFEVPLNGTDVEFAFCYPYTQEQMDETIEQCSCFDREIIGYSSMQRPIYRLFSGMDPNKPGAYIIARQHAAEVPGAWEVDGMIRFLSSDEGKSIREAMNWWFVPMVDTDGVEEGFYGKDQIYNDFNRAWHPSFPRRLELVSVEQDLRWWKEHCNGKVMFDMHGPGHAERHSYFVVHADTCDAFREELRGIHGRMNGILALSGLQPFDFHEVPAGQNTSAQSGMTSAFFAHSNGINGCTIECSYQGECSGRDYSIENYRHFGESLVKAISQTYLV